MTDVYRVLLAPSHLFGIAAVMGLLYVSFYLALPQIRTPLTNLQVAWPLHSRSPLSGARSVVYQMDFPRDKVSLVEGEPSAISA